MITFKYWLTSLFSILVKPTPETFRQITKDVKGVLGSSLAWIASTTGMTILVFGLADFYVGEFFPQMIIAIIIIPIWFLLLVFLLDFLNRKLFRRKKSYYEPLLFSTTLIVVINIIFDTIYALINFPIIYLDIALYIYPVVLLIISVFAITKAKLWQSIVIVSLGIGISIGAIFFISLFLTSLIQTVPAMF